MATQYRDMTGKTYSPSQVEKVGSVYYVTGTSIPVGPVDSSSGSEDTSTASSAGSRSYSSASSKTSSSSSSGGTVSPEKVEAELGMGGMLMPEMQVAYGGAPSGGYYVPTKTGWTKTSTPPQSWTAPYEEARRQAEYWQTTPEAYTARNAMIDALQARIRQLENQLTNWQSSFLPSPTVWQSSSLPTQTPVSLPTVETAPQVENVPAAAAPQQAAPLPAGVSQGAAGFSYQASTPPVLPTIDKLLETYRQVFGRSDQDVQQYLQSPEFQSVLRGNVPMWMEADPLWRRYLQMLGISRRLQGNQ